MFPILLSSLTIGALAVTCVVLASELAETRHRLGLVTPAPFRPFTYLEPPAADWPEPEPLPYWARPSTRLIPVADVQGAAFDAHRRLCPQMVRVRTVRPAPVPVPSLTWVGGVRVPVGSFDAPPPVDVLEWPDPVDVAARPLVLAALAEAIARLASERLPVAA
jgi:hypothetical protein